MEMFLVLAYMLSHSFVNGQLCENLPSLSAIQDDFYSAVNASDQAGNVFVLGEVFFNCITYGSPDGSDFRETTITARYEVEDGMSIGQVLYACVNMNGSLVWLSDDVVLKDGVAANGTERCTDCRELTPTTCSICADDCGDEGGLNHDCSACVCNVGYTGTTCNEDINECDIVPPVCEGGGICTNSVGSFTCSCPVPCTGGCNACCSSPCTRGGNCSSTSSDDFTCECPPGFTGKRCQDFQGGCYSSPCMNGGECNPVGLSVDEYECACPVGFTGVNCETEIDYCADEPCNFQGWCTNSPSGYTCTCLHGFTGSDCGQPLLTCTSNPTACGANGECITRTVDGLTNKVCSCNPGYAGEHCNFVVENCTNEMEPCFHRSTCIPDSGGNSNFSFSCNCFGNWVGFYCTECSLQCSEGQPDAQCARCICDDPNNNDVMCTPDARDSNANEDNSNDDSATATIAGAVVGGVAAVGIAVVMVIIAIYFIKKSSKPKGIVANTWIDSQLGSDPFAPAKESSMPRFSGSILGPRSAFAGSRKGRSSMSNNNMMPTETSGFEDFKDTY